MQVASQVFIERLQAVRGLALCLALSVAVALLAVVEGLVSAMRQDNKRFGFFLSGTGTEFKKLG